MTPVFGCLIAVSGLFGLAGCTGQQDQTVPDLAIAYVKRPIPIVPASNPPAMVDPDVREPAAFDFNGGEPGGDLYVRSSASPSASERNITLCITDLNGDGIGTGDVKDLDSSYDGEKLIFSLRLEDLDPNDDIVPTWNIYEYDVTAGGCPTRLVASDFEAEKGDDLGPVYLPDGRIVFTSSRLDLVGGAIQLNENLSPTGQFLPQDERQGQDSLVLHVMSDSGGDIKKISFNQSHDLDPSVLSSGEIVFSRWDNMGTSNAVNLFKIRPDGTELKALYGVHAHNVGTGGSTVQFLSPRELDDGRILGMIKPFNGSAGGGAPVLINVTQYADNNQPIWPYQGAGLAGNGQVNAVAIGVTTDDSISPAGRFRSVYPIRDNSNRALVSWTQCRLQQLDGSIIPCPSTIPGGAVEAMPVYGIYIYDLSSNTQLPVVIPQEGFIFDEPVVVAAHPDPAFLFDKLPGFGLDSTLSTERVGLLHIRSVYDFDGGFNNLGATGVPGLDVMADPTQTDADTRPARFLRIIKGAYIPEEVDPDGDDSFDPLNPAAFGISRQQGMREILGYTPIEPDGSVLVKVPANVPFAISVVDKDGRRIGGRHQNWLHLQSGEVLECNGCHEHNPTAPAEPLPHGYSDVPVVLNDGALIADVYPGANPAYVAEIGETMALTRIRTSCGTNNSGPLGLNVEIATCTELSPKLDMRFTDPWTDPAGTPTPDLDILYSDLVAMGLPLPTINRSIGCSSATWNPWNPICRTIINYETHIHPLWLLPRAGGARTCTNSACHNSLNNTRVPEAQLDLSDGQSALNGDPYHFKSYSELLVGDVERDASGVPIEDPVFDALGNPVYEVEVDANGDPVLDANGDPVLATDALGNFIQETQQIPVTASISVNGSRAGTFMDKFLLGGTHTGDLTAEEIRLLSEWIDIGAQYFNNPFDAPVN